MAIYEIKYSRSRVSRDLPQPLTNANTACRYLMKYAFDSKEMWREKAVAVFLDHKKIPLGHTVISMGTNKACFIDKKLIAKAALDSMADSIILAHNHTGGDPKPGSADIKETIALRNALATLDIELVDHIILTEKNFFSFAEEECMHIKRA